jgi:hypothetical protein
MYLSGLNIVEASAMKSKYENDLYCPSSKP